MHTLVVTGSWLVEVMVMVISLLLLAAGFYLMCPEDPAEMRRLAKTTKTTASNSNNNNIGFGNSSSSRSVYSGSGSSGGGGDGSEGEFGVDEGGTGVPLWVRQAGRYIVYCQCAQHATSIWVHTKIQYFTQKLTRVRRHAVVLL
jgi:hypothetical protein